MMKKKLLLSIVLFSIVNYSFSQLIEISKNNGEFNKHEKVDFEGAFTYSFNNINYIIDLSISNGTYTERAESGTVLSTGTFNREGDVLYQLTAVNIFSDALIKGVLYFKTISKTSTVAHIELFTTSNGSEGELIISKIQ